MPDYPRPEDQDVPDQFWYPCDYGSWRNMSPETRGQWLAKLSIHDPPSVRTFRQLCADNNWPVVEESKKESGEMNTEKRIIRDAESEDAAMRAYSDWLEELSPDGKTRNWSGESPERRSRRLQKSIDLGFHFHLGELTDPPSEKSERLTDVSKIMRACNLITRRNGKWLLVRCACLG